MIRSVLGSIPLELKFNLNPAQFLMIFWNFQLAVAGLQATNKGRHWVCYGARSSPLYRGRNINWACKAYAVSSHSHEMAHI